MGVGGGGRAWGLAGDWYGVDGWMDGWMVRSCVEDTSGKALLFAVGVFLKLRA
jgi:hypothetical protein